MRVSLKNIGDSERIIFDRNNVQRILRPGASFEADLHDKQAAKFERAMQEKKDSIEITRLSDIEDGSSETERRSEFTLRTGEGIEDGKSVIRAPGGDTTRVNVEQPKSRAEVEDPMPQRAHPEPERKPGDEIPHDLPDGQAPAAQPRVKLKGRQEHTAARAAQEPAQEKAPSKEPETATELLASFGSLGPEDAVRLATKVLPKGVLPQKPKPSQILAALRTRAKQESKEAKKARQEGAPSTAE